MAIKVYAAEVAPLSDPARFRRVYARVSAWRREKEDRFRFDRDKRLSLGAGAMLEAALVAEEVTDLTMTTGRNEKPRLAHVAGLHFNLSHSGTRVLCAISDHEIGCDVERVAQADMNLARRCFHGAEYAALLQCADPAEQNELFYRYWTLKESFMKATGLGFQLPLKDFCVTPGDGGIAIRQNVDDRSYFFKEFDRNDGYRYAVCNADRPLDGVSMWEVEIDSLNLL